MNYRIFLENALKQGARTTKWDIILPDSKNSQRLSVMAKDVSLPALELKPITMKYKGRSIPIAGQVDQTNDFSITFTVDQDHFIRKYFEDWMLSFDARGSGTSMIDKQYENELKRNISNESSLYRDITLLQYSFDSEVDPTSNIQPTAKYVLYGCFPKHISEFSYNNDNEAILDLKVSFSCIYYQREA